MAEIDAQTYSLPVGAVVNSAILPTFVPFAITSLGYLGSLMYFKLASECMAALKMLPILFLACLCFFRRTTSRESPKNAVCLGLLASSVGDYFLIWDDEASFLSGMAAFAVAHMLYIKAFGFKNFAPVLLLVAIAMATSVTWLFLPHLKDVLRFGVPVYIGLISMMFWRAFACLDSFNWTRASGAFGALVFALSDFNLALNAFYFKEPYNGHHLVTMITYYIGQFSIALATIDRDLMVKEHLRKTK